MRRSRTRDRWTLLAVALVTLSGGAARADTPAIAVNPGDAADLVYKLLHPAYAGHALQLSGTYALSAAAGQAGVDRLRAEASVDDGDERVVAARLGYLRLGDRHLRGANVMRLDEEGTASEVESEATVIHGALLGPALWEIVTSDGRSTFENRALIWADGGNAIEALTIRATLNGTTALRPAIAAVGAGIAVTGCTIDSESIGIIAYPPGRPFEGAALSSTIAVNLFLRRGALPGVVASTFVTRDASNHVQVARNRFVGGSNTSHMRIQNMGASDGVLEVKSTRNRYEGGGLHAISLFGGNSGAGPASGNHAALISVDDRFEGNHTALFVRGGAGNAVVDNHAELTLIRARFAANGVALDAAGIGGGIAGQLGAGSGNLATLVIRHADLSAGPAQAIALAHAHTASGTDNRLAIEGSRTAFARANPGVPVPDASFFGEE